MSDQLLKMIGPSYYSQSLTDKVTLSQQKPHQWTYTITTDLGVQEFQVQTHDKKVEVILNQKSITTLKNYYPYRYTAPVKINDKVVAKVWVQVTPSLFEIGEAYIGAYEVPAYYDYDSEQLPTEPVVHFFETVVR